MKIATLEKKIDDNKIFWWMLIILISLSIRVALSVFCGIIKHDVDFESWCIAGDLVTSGKNVYAFTTRYNYAPLWSIILGKFYEASQLFTNSKAAYRLIIIFFLTLIDFGIARLIAKRAGELWGMIFFINPISVTASAFNTQFDNTAVFLGALGILCLRDASKRAETKFDDIVGIIFLSLSLLMKHILWAFPVWILFNRNINTRKKFLYAFIPPLIFLLSFVPYWQEGSQGIINNVFMYRSVNNFPLFALDFINWPLLRHIGFPVFGLLMLAGAYIFHNEEFYASFLLYTMSLVCFTSALWPYYLPIPCMAMILFFREKSFLYFVLVLVRLLSKRLVCCVMVWCLLCYLIYYYICKNSNASR